MKGLTYNPDRDGVTMRPNIFIPWGVVTHPGLNHAAKLIYGVLQRYRDPDGRCCPNLTRLALDLGVCEVSMRTYIRALKRVGLIEVRRRSGRRNEYFFKKYC